MRFDKSWKGVVDKSLLSLSKEYLDFLKTDADYFPNYENFLNAFKTLSLQETKVILFGQDPYPRRQSAIGYAFIDGQVKNIFSPSGLSKEVNKATSLRNFIKMLLLSCGRLEKADLGQESISKISKEGLIESIYDLRDNFEKNGVLLLNTSLVFTTKEETSLHVKAFKPFIKTFLEALKDKDIELILFGRMAQDIEALLPQGHNFKLVKTVHPYNNSFIADEKICKYFAKMDLIVKTVK